MRTRRMRYGVACVLVGLVAACTASHGTTDDAGGVCVDFDASTYSKSCQADSDCVDVNAGRICETGCLCGGYAISAEALASYKEAFSAAVAAVSPGPPCSCPALGSARCVQQECVFCPNPAINIGVAIAAGCPDAG